MFVNIIFFIIIVNFANTIKIYGSCQNKLPNINSEFVDINPEFTKIPKLSNNRYNLNLKKTKKRISNKFNIQKKAMFYVKNILMSINTTDYSFAILNLRLLKEIPFEKIPSPLSLLYDLITGILDGREDFITGGFRELLYHDIKYISQGVLKSIIQNQKYVSKNTKIKTLKKLKSLQKNLNPNTEICHRAYFNLQYAICVIESLPVNKDVAWDSFYLLLCTLKIIITKDGEALNYILNTILENIKDIYNKSIVEQISIVDSLEYAILKQSKVKQFQNLMLLYSNSSSVYIKCKIIMTMGKICKLYYSGYLTNDYKDIAYHSFEKLLKIVNNTTKIVVDKSWLIKCTAIEQVILLENRLNNINAKKTVSRYIISLKNNLKSQKKSIFNRISNKLGIDSEKYYLLNIINNKKHIYEVNMLLEQTLEANLNQENQKFSFEYYFKLILAKNQEILKLLKSNK